MTEPIESLKKITAALLSPETMPVGIIKISELNNYPSTFRFQYKMGTRPGFVVSKEE